MEIVDNHQQNFEVFFVSNIPFGKAEMHLQKIFETHFSGSLISLTKARGNKRKKTTTTIVTIPIGIVRTNPMLQKALAGDRGVPIELSPLQKLYFRKKASPMNSTEQIIYSLKKEIQSLKYKMEEMNAKHQAEMNEIRNDMKASLDAQKAMQRSVVQVCEFINSIQHAHI